MALDVLFARLVKERRRGGDARMQVFGRVVGLRKKQVLGLGWQLGSSWQAVGKQRQRSEGKKVKGKADRRREGVRFHRGTGQGKQASIRSTAGPYQAISRERASVVHMSAGEMSMTGFGHVDRGKTPVQSWLSGGRTPITAAGRVCSVHGIVDCPPWLQRVEICRSVSLGNEPL